MSKKSGGKKAATATGTSPSSSSDLQGPQQPTPPAAAAASAAAASARASAGASALPPPKAEPDCEVCGERASFTCTGCGFTHYCSKACQLKHWPVHKIPCKESPIYKANQELAAMKKTLAEQEEELGLDDEETLRTVNDIGAFLQKQGASSRKRRCSGAALSREVSGLWGVITLARSRRSATWARCCKRRAS